MITSTQALARYGDPRTEAAMTLLTVPTELRTGAVPARIYCNRDLVQPLLRAFEKLRDANLADEIKTWDGCFNIRSKKVNQSLSLHSWGLAIDINASWNQLGKTPTLPANVVLCFLEAGFEWGGTWDTPDGMHFQLKDLP